MSSNKSESDNEYEQDQEIEINDESKNFILNIFR